MNYGLSESTIRKIRTVLKEHPYVDQAIQYGSRAKDNYRNGSDIELTLRGGSGLTLMNCVEFSMISMIYSCRIRLVCLFITKSGTRMWSSIFKEWRSYFTSGQ